MLHPTGCTPYIRKDGLTGLKVKTPANQDTILLEPSEFRHTYDARMPGDIKGASPLQVCDAAFKLADETIGHASAIMRNQSMPAAAITSPPEMDDEDMKKFQASWERRHKGPGNASKIAMLYAGQDLKTVQFSPADAELIKSREMSGRDITTAMRVPPFMVGDAGGATMWGTGVHKIFLGFSNVRLRAPRKRMEALLTSVVKLDKGTDAVRVKLRQDHLMYGDFKEKVETFMQLHGAGVLNDDELRAGLGFKPRGQR